MCLAEQGFRTVRARPCVVEERASGGGLPPCLGAPASLTAQRTQQLPDTFPPRSYLWSPVRLRVTAGISKQQASVVPAWML